MTKMNTNPLEIRKLVDVDGLITALFEESCRPSVRWVRTMQSQRKISYKKIGHLVFFDVAEVRKDLEENCTVNARSRTR